MDDLKKCYELFGLSLDGSLKEIKQAYSDLVQIHHPDRFAHNRPLQKKAEEKLKAINLCYEKIKEASENSQSSEVPQNSSDSSTANTTAQASQPKPQKQYPRVELNHDLLQFQVTQGAKATQTIIVSNSNASTMLEDRWEVVAHRNDPPHTPDAHSWISVTPSKFFCQNNRVNCRVQVDTSKLKRLEQYERQLILHTNASVPEQRVAIKVQTGDLPSKVRRNIPYLSLSLLLSMSGLLGWLGSSGYLSSLANVMTSPLGYFALWFILPSIGIALISGILGALIGGLRSGLNEAKAWALDSFKYGAIVALVYVLRALIYFILTSNGGYLIFLVVLLSILVIFVVSSLSGTGY